MNLCGGRDCEVYNGQDSILCLFNHFRMWCVSFTICTYTILHKQEFAYEKRGGGGRGGERDFARNFHFVLSTWSKRSFAYRLSICLRFETSKIGSGFGKVLHDTSFRLSFCPSLCPV